MTPARRDGTPGRPSRRSASRTQSGQPQRTNRKGNIRGARSANPARPPKTVAPKVAVSNAKPAKKQHVEGGGDSDVAQFERLQKVLARAGVASRRVAEDLIDQGRVEVDGVIVREQGMRIDPNTAVVRVDGERVLVNDTLIHLVLNKPRGLQSTMSDDMGRPCVGDLVSEQVSAGQRLFHVGRLDADTEGLLLLTNDGELAHRLMHPSYEVTKTYVATVLGEADHQLVRTLRSGIELEDGPAKADSVQIIDTFQGKSLVKVVLHEGRKHIVRRMLKAAGYPVLALVRTKIDSVILGEQKPGTLRRLNSAELASLYQVVGL